MAQLAFGHPRSLHSDFGSLWRNRSFTGGQRDECGECQPVPVAMTRFRNTTLHHLACPRHRSFPYLKSTFRGPPSRKPVAGGQHRAGALNGQVLPICYSLHTDPTVILISVGLAARLHRQISCFPAQDLRCLFRRPNRVPSRCKFAVLHLFSVFECFAVSRCLSVDPTLYPSGMCPGHYMVSRCTKSAIDYFSP